MSSAQTFAAPTVGRDSCRLNGLLPGRMTGSVRTVRRSVSPSAPSALSRTVCPSIRKAGRSSCPRGGQGDFDTVFGECQTESGERGVLALKFAETPFRRAVYVHDTPRGGCPWPYRCRGSWCGSR